VDWFFELNYDHGHVVASLTSSCRRCQAPVEYPFAYSGKLAFLHGLKYGVRCDITFRCAFWGRKIFEDRLRIQCCVAHVLVHHRGATYWFSVELIQNSAFASLITSQYWWHVSPLNVSMYPAKNNQTNNWRANKFDLIPSIPKLWVYVWLSHLQGYPYGLRIKFSIAWIGTLIIFQKRTDTYLGT